MASNQYGSLGPVQQYNQLSFSVIPQPPHPQQLHHLQQQHQQQHRPQHPQHHPRQQHQHLQSTPTTTTTAAVPPPTYQHTPHTPILPPTNNVVAQQQQQQQQQGINPNTNTTQPPAAETTTPSNPTPDEPKRKRRRVGRPPKSQATRDYLDKRANAPPLPPPPPQPPQVHTPRPLSKGPYNTSEDAVFSLQLHVFSTGYGVSQKRTVKEKLPSGRYDPEGDVIRRDFACDRGGSDFVSQSTGERRRESKKCGCPWKAVARKLKREGDRWFLEVLDSRHNHPVTPPDQMHTIASYRRWQRENSAGIRSTIDRLARVAAMPARQVADYLKGQFADPDLDRVDKNILRALSMSDVELPNDAAGQGSVVFDVIGRRPTIILQETPGGTVPAEDEGIGPIRNKSLHAFAGMGMIKF